MNPSRPGDAGAPAGRDSGLRFETLHGAAIGQRLEALAELRMAVFREWPYLYEGDPAYEQQYLRPYVEAPRAFALLVFDGARPVGATTAIPLADEAAELQRPFTAAGLDPARVFYNGESVLLPGYRGRGLYRGFFEAREAHARTFTGYDRIAHCAVQRPPDHPARPADYTPLDGVWRRFGYTPRPDLVASFPWRDVGDTHETDKPLMFWIKPL